MKTYDEIKDLIERLRNNKSTLGHGEYGVDPLCEQAADELEAMHDLLCKQQVIIRRIYAEQLPDTWFVAGELGEKDANGLPKYITVCPAYGVDWVQIYEKADRTIGGMGS